MRTASARAPRSEPSAWRSPPPRSRDLEAVAGIDWARLLRRGQKQGRVLLEFTDGSRIDLRFNRSRAWFVGGAPRMEGFVRGFGATRLLGPG